MKEFEFLTDSELKRSIKCLKLTIAVSIREKDPICLVDSFKNILSQFTDEYHIRIKNATTNK